MEVDTDEREELEAQLEPIDEDASDVVAAIERAVNSLNQASGYDPRANSLASPSSRRFQHTWKR